MSQPKRAPEPPRDPTLRELRATLALVWMEIDNHGAERDLGKRFRRIYDHMSWLLDSYLFDVDTWADDGGRE